MAEGHEKPHEPALRPADADLPEVGPVDLGLLGREEAEPHRRLGPPGRPQPEGAQAVAEVVLAAAVAPRRDLPPERAGRQVRRLLEPLPG